MHNIGKRAQTIKLRVRGVYNLIKNVILSKFLEALLLLELLYLKQRLWYKKCVAH